MASLPAEAATSFRADLLIVQAKINAGVVPSRNRADRRLWEVWCTFVSSLNLDPYLSTIRDKVPILQVFADRVRRGELALDGAPMRARSAEAYLRAVGQAHARMGRPDPRKDNFGKTDWRIGRQFKAYKKEDPPPGRVKPVPISLIHKNFEYQHQLGTPKSLVLAYVVYVAFYFLMRPGEYCDSSAESHPFCLKDVRLWVGGRAIDPLRAPFPVLRRSTFCALVFTDQKNCVRNEMIGHGASGHRYACPVRSLVELVILTRQAGGGANSPLGMFRNYGCPASMLSAKDVTAALRQQARLYGDTVGITESDISARSLRNAGAQALLNAGVDTDRIGLIGRWKSGALLRYLIVQARPVMQGFASRMLRGGDYDVLSATNVVDIPAADPQDPYAGDPYE